MNYHWPQYGGVDRKPTNFTYDYDRNSGRVSDRQQQQQQQQSPYQVDSWRSYRNDTTNLAQMSTYSNYQDYNYGVTLQQPLGSTNSVGFNPSVPAYQPANTNHQHNPTQSHFTPYQPLRISNGQQEMMGQQHRFHSSTANNRNGGRYSLRSRVTVNDDFTIFDVPIPSIEQPQPWGLPINTRFDTTDQALRHVAARRSPSVTPPVAPSPSPEYLDQASTLPTNLASPQKLLIVLDLNGTLLKRAVSRGTTFVLRPGVTNLMDYLFTNHVVMVYSSARPENVTGMVSKLMHPKQRKKLAAIWARDKLDLNAAQYQAKVQVYKRLDKIWADKQIQQRAVQGRKWDQSNTVLVDDSYLKALAQPYNLLRVEEFENDRPRPEVNATATRKVEHEANVQRWITAQQKIVMDLQEKLELLKWSADVSQTIRLWQREEEDKANNNSSSGGMIEERAKQDLVPDPDQIQLLTPRSPEYEPEYSFSDKEQSFHELDTVVDLTSNGDVDVDLSRSRSDGSVSPVDESVWKDILEGREHSVQEDVLRTPKSLGG